MHFSELTAPELRVLGCLIEKRWTTPDQYPLSLNALRLACNQSTNRDPVTAYDEHTVREAAQRLSKYGLARLASGHSSRSIKYRHLAEESLGLDREELAVLCVLLLRGPQTPGELKGRSERLARLESLEAIERVLGALAAQGYARRLDRRPGQKEDRFMHLLGGDGGASVSEPAVASYGPGAAASADDGAAGAGGAGARVAAPIGSPAPAVGASPVPAVGVSPVPAVGVSPAPAVGVSPAPAGGVSPVAAVGVSPVRASPRRRSRAAGRGARSRGGRAARRAD